MTCTLTLWVKLSVADILKYTLHLRGGGHIDFGVDPVGLVSRLLVCTISCEPVVGFLPNLHGYIIVT